MRDARAFKISELAERLGASPLAGSAVGLDSKVFQGASLDEAGDGHVTFIRDARHKKALEGTRASVVIVDEAMAADVAGRPYALLIHPNPAAAFARALEALNPGPAMPPGVHPSAVLEEGAKIADSASISALCFVGSGARIGPGTALLPGAHVGAGAGIGADCVLGPRSVVADGCILGDRVRLQSGSVIGSDGFGYAPDTDPAGEPMHRKVPQIGTVRIEDDVEIGAGSCVDRATTGETVVGRGTKIDNLVQVGHNSVIGPLCILCGQVGLAGSSRLGRGVMLGGQVGIAGHLKISDGAKVGAQSGVGGDVAPGDMVSGSPALPHRVWMRAALAFKELPDLLKRVRRIEKKLFGSDR